MSCVLRVRSPSLTPPSEVHVFPGAVHGFTVRGDMHSPAEREQKEKATAHAIAWFQKYLH